MTAILLWDRDGTPPDGPHRVLCWRSYHRADEIRSIPRYLEDHAERLRGKYLAFIHDLGETRIRGKRLVEHLDRGDGFSLWWMTLLAEKSPFNSPRIYDCLRLLALEEMLVEHRPTQVHLASADGDLASAVRCLSGKLGVGFVWQDGREGSRSHGGAIRGAWWGIRKGLMRLARQVWRKWPLRELEAPPWFSGKFSVFLCSYFIHLDPESFARGQFYSRQWEVLPGLLHRMGRRANWMQHFFFTPVAPNARSGVTCLRRFNQDPEHQGYHAFLDSYLSWRVVARVLGGYWWLLRVSWRLRHVEQAFTPKGSSASLWPLLRADWLSSVGGPAGVSSLLWIELFDAALSEMPPQGLGLYLYENEPWEKALIRAWRRYGHGELIGVQHASAPFWHLYYFEDPRSLAAGERCALPLPDRVALNGPMWWKAFVDTGFPIERLVEAEALRYLAVPGRVARRSGEEDPSNRSAPSCMRILIVGDMIQASTHGLLKLIAESLRLIPGKVRLTFKAHPNRPMRLEEYPELVIEETTEALPAILGNFDVAVAASGTSAALDVFQAGVPVILHSDGDELNLSPLRGQAGVPFVSTPEELSDALRRVIADPREAADANSFFFLDPALPRWRDILSSSHAGGAQ